MYWDWEACKIALTALVIVCILTLMGFGWRAAIASGLALSMSSTAMVLQSLKEKGIGQTQAGKSSLAVLLFQDIAVIPLLALLPFLALQSGSAADGEQSNALSALPGWIQASLFSLQFCW